MNDILRERVIRKLDSLSEDRIYPILDYIDFLESKYAPKPSVAQNPLKRFAEGVEDTLRAGKMSAGVIGGTMSVMNRAVGVLTDVANAGKSVATEIVGVASSVTSSRIVMCSPPASSSMPATTLRTRCSSIRRWKYACASFMTKGTGLPPALGSTFRIRGA